MMAVAAAAILSPMLLLPASAQKGQGTPRTDPGQPDDPDCWGEVSSTVAQRDDDQPGLGEHASDPIPDREGDHDTPRAGVETKLRTPLQNMVQMWDKSLAVASLTEPIHHNK
jgi:hypothetical protein